MNGVLWRTPIVRYFTTSRVNIQWEMFVLNWSSGSAASFERGDSWRWRSPSGRAGASQQPWWSGI